MRKSFRTGAQVLMISLSLVSAASGASASPNRTRAPSAAGSRADRRYWRVERATGQGPTAVEHGEPSASSLTTNHAGDGMRSWSQRMRDARPRTRASTSVEAPVQSDAELDRLTRAIRATTSQAERARRAGNHREEAFYTSEAAALHLERAESLAAKAQATEGEHMPAAQLGLAAVTVFHNAAFDYERLAEIHAGLGNSDLRAAALGDAARASVRAMQTFRAFLRDPSQGTIVQMWVLDTNEAAAASAPNLHQRREFLEHAVRAADAVRLSEVADGAAFRTRREGLREQLNQVNASLASQR